MTADERIEKLLNRFGQTISDLPKANGKYTVYNNDEKGTHIFAALKMAMTWHGFQEADTLDCLRLQASYICHLSDIIDRMETALETAANNASCEFCEKSWAECKQQPNNEEFVCDFRVDDEWLIP